MHYTRSDASWGTDQGVEYATPEGKRIRFRRRMARVRMFDEAGHQVGPEQPTTAAAVAYAMHHGWEIIDRAYARNLRGGQAERLGVTVEDVEPDELRRGTKHEMEHTDDPALAQEIALDHLAERQSYYEELDALESGACDPAPKTQRSRYKRNLGLDEHGHVEDPRLPDPKKWSAIYSHVPSQPHRVNVLAYYVEPGRPDWDSFHYEVLSNRTENRWWYTYGRGDYMLNHASTTSKKVAEGWIAALSEAERKGYITTARRMPAWERMEAERQARASGMSSNELGSGPYYVWSLKPGTNQPLATEGPHGPHDLEGAKTYARIAATQGAHDRAVSRGRDPSSASFEVVRVYRAGTGERAV